MCRYLGEPCRWTVTKAGTLHSKPVLCRRGIVLRGHCHWLRERKHRQETPMCPECPAACMTARMICLNQDKNIARKDKHPGPGVDNQRPRPDCSVVGSGVCVRGASATRRSSRADFHRYRPESLADPTAFTKHLFSLDRQRVVPLCSPATRGSGLAEPGAGESLPLGTIQRCVDRA